MKRRRPGHAKLAAIEAELRVNLEIERAVEVALMLMVEEAVSYGTAMSRNGKLVPREAWRAS